MDLVKTMELPSPKKLGMRRVFEFAQYILEAAEREQVMRVIESPSPWLFKPEAGRTWLDAMKERARHSPA